MMSFQKIKQVKSIGVQKTIDFEVNHKDHNFYAEGIVVSNSHSTGYSYITAICAYLKANYPVQFFTALLNNAKNEQNPIDEIKAIKKELFHFDITLAPPDITKSNIDKFSYEGNRIIFPLSNIKGISDKAIEKLKKFKLNTANKFQIFNAAKE